MRAATMFGRGKRQVEVADALGVLRPTFDASAGTDGFVSVEVAPELARDTDATIAAARQLHDAGDASLIRVGGGHGHGCMWRA